jgi:D-3-phosphoglycerate dehydrogenase
MEREILMSKKKNPTKIMVTTHPFGETNDTPIRQLKDYTVHYNDVGRKYSDEELEERLVEFQPDAIIAGTEEYSAELFDKLPNLKIISRVGIGLDSIPLDECDKRNITVAYTPDAPSNAVAELTICQMLNALRRVQDSDAELRTKVWDRYIGREIRSCTVGIIGCGRIGSLVIEKLNGLKPRRIYVNDIVYDKAHDLPRCEYAKKMQILSECDIISIHIPYDEVNKNFISKEELAIMKKNVCLINMSRGGIINEDDLYDFLLENKDATACVDAFTSEPYFGKLLDLENTYLTPHIGSCSEKSRFHMEVGATEEVLNFLNNKPLINKVC